MTLEQQKRIIRKAQQKLPVPVVRIAHELGLNVYAARGWADGLSGMIKRADDGTYDIYVNANHAKVRRRFTIAHEIAHYVLHRESIGNGITDDVLYRSGLSNRQEAHANRFAADILIPWALLDPLIDAGETNITELAKKCVVSTSAMSIRLGVPFEMNDELVGAA